VREVKNDYPAVKNVAVVEGKKYYTATKITV